MNLSLTTIGEIANEYVLVKGISRDQLPVLISILFRGLTHNQIYYFKKAKSQIVEKNSIGYVRYPDDCISIIRVGGLFNGRVYPIFPDDTLDTFVDDECGEEVPFLVPPDDPTFFPTCYDFGSYFNRLTYSDNKDERQIRINGETPTSVRILLTYVFSGVEQAGDTFVSRAYYEVLRAWLEWQLDNQNGYLKQNYADFLKESRKFRHRFTQDELIDYFRLIKSRL